MQETAAGGATQNSLLHARTVSPELSVIVPTLNERDNIPLIVSQLERALVGVNWEVIFVDDDSPDGTAAAARDLAHSDPRVRCLKRLHRRGLAGAAVEGMLSSSAQVVAVMDADLQHDESLLPQMLERIRGGADLVVGTRRDSTGSLQAAFSNIRRWGSALATKAAQYLTGVSIRDPMSGFFMIRRDTFDVIAPRLSTQGFKLLLDIVASHRGRLAVSEVDYEFRPRRHGQSKLDGLVVLDYIGLLLAKVSGDLVSIRFVLFLLVGATGLAVHLAALRAALSFSGIGFDLAQAFAAYTAMTWNFLLNNQLTYRDHRLKGLAAVRGLLTFYVVCSIGALANVGVASWIYGGRPNWWIAGTAGALMGAVFNYAASSALTWRHR